MEIRIELIDAEAIKATNIREMKDIKTLVNDIKENGIYEAIKIGKLNSAEAEDAYQRRLTEEAKRQDTAIEAGKRVKPREIIKPIYGILDGHTRYAAATKAKLLTIKVEEIQRRQEFQEKMYAYKANIARRDMEEWQKGEMIEAIKAETNKSVEEIAKEIGWSKAYGYKVIKKLKEHIEGQSAKTIKITTKKDIEEAFDNMVKKDELVVEDFSNINNDDELLKQYDAIADIITAYQDLKKAIGNYPVIAKNLSDRKAANMKAMKEDKSAKKNKPVLNSREKLTVKVNTAKVR